MWISLSDEALADFETATDWYLEALAFIAADDFADEFEDALALLGKFPYSLIYRMFPDHIRIIAVANTAAAQDIGWRGGELFTSIRHA